MFANLFKRKKQPREIGERTFFRELRTEFLIHELKDPLAVIETNVRFLLEKKDSCGALSPRQEKALKRTLRNALKAREMLYSLLETGRAETACFTCGIFSPVESGLQVVVDCVEIMSGLLFETVSAATGREAVYKCLEAGGIVVTADSAADDTRMHQDEMKYRQVLGNLVKNALHYRNQQVEISFSRNGGRLIVDVTDDGPGIEPARQESIFHRYSRLPPETGDTSPRKGHGLGLAGAKIMAERIGGSIRLFSDRGKGARFRLEIPVEINLSPR